MKRLISLLLAATLLLAFVAGCSKTPSGGGTTPPADKDSFVIALDSDPVRIDPIVAYDFTTNPIVNQITQGLLSFNEQNELVPLLAESWEQVDDLTYVYQIRSNVTFSDGSPMTMDDVLYSLERNRSAGSYVEWMFSSVEKMEATGDWELTVTLSQPDAIWQYVFGTMAGHIVQKAFAEEKGDAVGTADTGIIGTGPYTYVSWQSGSEVVLEKNPNYWGEDAGHFQKLIFKIVAEDSTRVTALKTGEVDCIVPAPASQMDVLLADEAVSVTSSPGFGIVYAAFNTQRAPFDNADVRKAVEMAIDLESIQANLVKTTGEPSTVLPNSFALFGTEKDRWVEYLDKAPKHVFDAEGAKALLATAGYADGFTIDLVTNEDGLRNSIALAMQENLSAIGVTLNIVKVSGDEHTAYQFGEVLDANGLRDYDILIAGWEADFPDPSGNLQPMYEGNIPYNAAAYDNPLVTQLIQDQAQESDTSLRNDMMFSAMDIVVKDTPYINLFYPVKSIAINSAYEGVYMNASWIWNIAFQNVVPVS